MWNYSQTLGRLTSEDGLFQSQGYSGAKPEGYNNPEMQNVKNVGPIPQGRYSWGNHFECVETLSAEQQCPDCDGIGFHKHGPHVIRLIPDPGNEMFGRSGFLCHGDSTTKPGSASEGCIIQPLATRVQMMDSNDHVVEVTD